MVLVRAPIAPRDYNLHLGFFPRDEASFCRPFRALLCFPCYLYELFPSVASLAESLTTMPVIAIELKDGL